MGAMTFQTPEPISATVDVIVGDVRIAASERSDTVVDVRPSDPSNKEDRRVAEQTRVECAQGHLLVKTPKLRSWSIRSHGGSVDVTVELPAGSAVVGAGQLTDFHTEGELGDLRIKTGIGRIGVERAARLNLKAGAGEITVERATGHADVNAGSGDVRLSELDDTAVVKNSNGDTWIGVAGGELRVNAANGDIAVEQAQAGVGAKSSNGSVRLGEVVRGSVVLETKIGELEVGIREGSAAWLDVSSSTGRVLNALEAADAPEPASETVRVRARTTIGDVVIGRS
jgi:DUF4097 and DUF4098 domain-containing protein YvlB